MACSRAHQEENAGTYQDAEALHFPEKNQHEIHDERHQEDIQTIHPAEISEKGI
jgi:hypothetical protein